MWYNPKPDTVSSCQFLLHYGNKGANRRKAILFLAEIGDGIHVNRKWCPQVKDDSDLQKLLKQGKLVQVRRGYGSSKHTVLVTPALADVVIALV